MELQIRPDDSYAVRRKLFKHIWDTAMTMDDTDVLKPKVIRTLRLEDVDTSAGKKKKQRIKNLRTVCRKILDFCDRQDAEEIYYNKVAKEGTPYKNVTSTTSPKTKRKRKHSPNRKAIKARDRGDKVSRNTSPIKISFELNSRKENYHNSTKKKKIKRKKDPDYMIVARAHFENTKKQPEATTVVKHLKHKAIKKKTIRKTKLQQKVSTTNKPT